MEQDLALKNRFKEALERNLKYELARSPSRATERDWWLATSKAVQEIVLDRYIDTQAAYWDKNVRRVYYLSLEFLMGRMLSNNLRNSGVYQAMKDALADYGQDVEDVIDEEYDMALGNGGLGRLAACFLDSMATLDLPAMGYGIRYEFGLFRQQFENGYQTEHPDRWLKFGNVWEVCHPEYTQVIQLYGHIENHYDEQGRYCPKWVNTRNVTGVPYDVPIVGFGTTTVNILRLWEATSQEELDFHKFNEGGYVEAVQSKVEGETISKVLYPNDQTENGKELRLCQQYFFVACSLKDIIRRHKSGNNTWSTFADKACIQLNDTHPAVAIAELQRILHDEEGMSWEEAWDIVSKTFAYTNHTLLPEALEQWSVPLFSRVLPRHAQIIFEINRRFMDQVEAKWPGNVGMKQKLSIIAEGHTQMFRMANLAVVGSFSVNGVAAIHSELLVKRLFPEFNELYPGKFNNKTNGVTPRRWLYDCNPRLAELLISRIGDGWVKELSKIKEIEPFADDPEFRAAYRNVKHENKKDLAAIIKKLCHVDVDPNAIFDVQIKRLHEYKRQHLNLLFILTLYRRLLQNPDLDVHPRVFIFGAKAAPGYDLAKNIIKAINAAADVINNDERIKGKIKIAFLPNYRVTLAESIIPASDVSEQISTAGKEASGTGNMKLALNGALTIGTLDGANIEIKEEVGDENIFIFGMDVDQVEQLRKHGYNPADYYHNDEELRAVIDWLGSGYFTPNEPDILAPIRHSLVEGGDPFMVLADYRSYVECQEKVDKAYRDQEAWSRSAILNTARNYKFSSDRTIQQYADEIWKLKAFKR